MKSLLLLLLTTASLCAQPGPDSPSVGFFGAGKGDGPQAVSTPPAVIDPNYVQQSYAFATNITITNVSAGNVLVLGYIISGTSFMAAPIDDKGNTWNVITNDSEGSAFCGGMYYCKVTTGGTVSVSTYLTNTPTTGTRSMLIELTNCSAAPLDVYNLRTTASTTVANSATNTTTSAKTYWVYFARNNNLTSWSSPQAGWGFFMAADGAAFSASAVTGTTRMVGMTNRYSSIVTTNGAATYSPSASYLAFQAAFK